MNRNMSTFRVLFVCMGNICRSPAGEGVLLSQLADADLPFEVEVDSAGTIDFHTGKPADDRMRRAATARGIDLTSRARQVRGSDFDQFDLILAMDDDNFHDLEALRAGPDQRAELRRFCDFVDEFDDTEVPDPYYGSDAGFEHVLDLLQDGCAGIINHIKSSA